jgi:glycosyltransferase involved in cell wall biosynthesis
MKPFISIVVPMYNEEKVIPIFFKRLNEVLKELSDFRFEIVVVNDNPDVIYSQLLNEIYIFNNEVNIGVGKSKNKALQYLLDAGCDHIFLIEDDIFIKDPKVFEKYIEASKITGIQHFNFSQHGLVNKSWPDGDPAPRFVVDYGKITIPLYPHCVGAFSYYSRKCLETAGLIDEQYFNACEHVDHTLEIIKKGIHPPFWYFADIENSWEYLGDEPWSMSKSTISSNPNHKQMMKDADHIFVKKHGHYPGQTPMVDLDVVGKSLKQIKNEYS